MLDFFKTEKSDVREQLIEVGELTGEIVEALEAALGEFADRMKKAYATEMAAV